MSEKFKIVEDLINARLSVWATPGGHQIRIEDDDGDSIHLRVEEARALRDWLNEALP